MLKAQPFQSPKAREEQQPDGGEAGRVFASRRQFAHRLAQRGDLAGAEPALARLSRELANAARRIGFDQSSADSVLQNGVKGRHRAGGNAVTAGRSAAAASDSRLGGHAARAVGLHAFDVAETQAAHLLRPDQRPDVRFDTAAVHHQSRGFDRAIASPKDASLAGLPQIPVADLADRDGAAVAGGGFGRINSLGDGEQPLVRIDPSLLDGHQPKPPDHRSPMALGRGAVLDDEALQALRADAHAKAFQLAIPDEKVRTRNSNLGRSQTLDDAFREFFHVQQSLAADLLPRRYSTTLGSKKTV